MRLIFLTSAATYARPAHFSTFLAQPATVSAESPTAPATEEPTLARDLKSPAPSRACTAANPVCHARAPLATLSAMRAVVAAAPATALPAIAPAPAATPLAPPTTA